MQQHGSIYYPADPPAPSDPGERVKIELFQDMDTFHVKLNGIMNAAIW